MEKRINAGVICVNTMTIQNITGLEKPLEKLIEVVYNKIINLDFPDVTKYSKDTKGIKQFEEDLIEEKV